MNWSEALVSLVYVHIKRSFFITHVKNLIVRCVVRAIIIEIKNNNL